MLDLTAFLFGGWFTGTVLLLLWAVSVKKWRAGEQFMASLLIIYLGAIGLQVLVLLKKELEEVGVTFD